ncbi:MAG: alpha/beta fold hydrolase [Rubrivivax sp.]
MNTGTQRVSFAGPAGTLEGALDAPAADTAARGVAVLCHPHPQHGGTLNNKVVQTLARAFVQLGYHTVRFNFRGVGASQGSWDEGRGEVDDVLAVVEAQRAHHPPGTPLVLGGFSFGAAMAAHAAARLAPPPERLVLIGPAVANFSPPAVSQDTLVVHGETDDVVPLADVLDWARPQTLPVTVVPGVGHFFHGQLGLLKQLVTGAWHR